MSPRNLFLIFSVATLITVLLWFFTGESDDDDGSMLPTMDLVKMFELGGGEKDWAGKVLWKRGAIARNDLIRCMNTDEGKSHRDTIVFILITDFPSDETTRAIERVVDEEQDPQKKAALQVLLKSQANAKK